jgi:hypothetical protein
MQSSALEVTMYVGFDIVSTPAWEIDRGREEGSRQVGH